MTILYRIIASDFARVSARAFALVHDFDLARDFVHDFDLALVHDCTRYLALDHPLDLARDFVLARDLARDFVRALDFARDLVRDLFLVRFFEYTILSHHKRERRLFERYKDSSTSQELAYGYLDVYLTLIILKGRIEGKLPVYEGILIVKERKSE